MFFKYQSLITALLVSRTSSSIWACEIMERFERETRFPENKSFIIADAIWLTFIMIYLKKERRAGLLPPAYIIIYFRLLIISSSIKEFCTKCSLESSLSSRSYIEYYPNNRISYLTYSRKTTRN